MLHEVQKLQCCSDIYHCDNEWQVERIWIEVVLDLKVLCQHLWHDQIGFFPGRDANVQVKVDGSVHELNGLWESR